jgi:class 3 adenylate cyclase/pimeloyl-ACP methyl ester carboxylesterase
VFEVSVTATSRTIRAVVASLRNVLQPQTRYARAGGVSIAYQAFGSGPPDLVLLSTFWNQIEHHWELPSFARALERLGSFARVIMLDKRGSGLSDRVVGTPSAEERMDDIRVVMEAVGSDRAALLGASEGGTLSALFAATYPERTDALIIYGSTARWRDWIDEAAADFMNEYFESAWGSGDFAAVIAPSLSEDEGFHRWFARLERLTATPGAARDLMRWNAEIDVRAALPAITAPTLVLHRSGDMSAPVEGGRYLAEHIPGARFVELPGDEHYPFIGDVDRVVDEIEEFLTGERPRRPLDRALATVLFTDIVASTERAAALGDRRWHDLLERHDASVRRELQRFGGREVKRTGDGFLATFDGPARGVRCAAAIRDALAEVGVEVRSGLHTGECELFDDDIGGIAVHIAARVNALAGAREVLVSGTVKDLVVGSEIEFSPRGETPLKGIPGRWSLFTVESA